VVTSRTGERIVGTVVQDDVLSVVIDADTGRRLTLPLETIQDVVRDTDRPGPLLPDPKPPPESLFETRLPLPHLSTDSTEIPLAPRPTLASSTNVVASVRWDGRLRYQLSTRVIRHDSVTPGSTWIESRLKLQGRIGAKLAIDTAAFSSQEGQQPIPGGVQLRTFQMLTEGTVGIWLTNQYLVELGLIGDEFYLNKAFWRIIDLPYFGNLTVGYFTVPQTLENIMAFGSLTLMEPSAGTAAFSPGKRAGIEWHRTFYNQRVAASAGIFSVGQDPSINFGNSSQSLAEPVFRASGLPWTARDRWMHLGLSQAFIFPQDAEVEFRARPESRMAPFLVNTGTIDADQAGTTGLEAAWGLGPLLVQSEYFNSVVWTDGSAAVFHGAYVMAGWMLTGEARPYNRNLGVPTRVDPSHPLWGPNSGWGAWEAAGRLSVVDLTSASINGGQMRIVMGGLNWYWNEYLRLQLNCGYANVTGGPSPGKLYLVEARLEGQF
jgi:phosphate-selective porin OprO/OprP